MANAVGAFKRMNTPGNSYAIEDELLLELTDSRFLYNDGLMVGSRMNFHLGWPAELSAKFIYSPEQNGSALMADLQFYARNGLAVLFGLDIVGSEDEDTNTFFNSNRNNDRFFGGVSYVF